MNTLNGLQSANTSLTADYDSTQWRSKNMANCCARIGQGLEVQVNGLKFACRSAGETYYKPLSSPFTRCLVETSRKLPKHNTTLIVNWIIELDGKRTYTSEWETSDAEVTELNVNN